MIVDNAECDLDMLDDPFLEAGIEIPEELPQKTPATKRKTSLFQKVMRIENKNLCIANAVVE